MAGFLTAEQEALIQVANAMKSRPFEEAVKGLVARGVLSRAYLNWSYAAFRSAAQRLLANPATQRAIGAGVRRTLAAAAASGGKAIGAALGGALTVLAVIVGVLSAGAVMVAGYEGYQYYQARQEEALAEQRAADQQRRVDEHRSAVEARGQKRVCPPAVPHMTMCPWSGQGGVRACGPGWCWDGGPHGTGACKPLSQPPNSKRTYTRDLECRPGYQPVTDECTHVLVACVRK